MQKDCINCNSGNIISTNCIRTEEELSFEYSSFNDLLQQLDKNTTALKELFVKDIDKMWIKNSQANVVDYIQDIIVQIDLILKELKKKETIGNTKFEIKSELFVNETTLLNFMNVIAKEVHQLKNNTNYTSGIYVP